MAITKLTRHDNHPVSVHICKPKSTHYAALRCNRCNTHIQWLNRQEAERIVKLNVNVYNYKSAEEFI